MSDRSKRLQKLLRRVSRRGTPDWGCLSTAQLLENLAETYAGPTMDSRRRMIERDLQQLIEEEKVEVVKGSSRPRRYRAMSVQLEESLIEWPDTVHQVQDLIAVTASRGALDPLWEGLIHEMELLASDRLRVVSDTLRLQPVQVRQDVVLGVVLALVRNWALSVQYRNAQGEPSAPVLHPQALFQRGPIVYLFALKDDEQEVRMYALHRMQAAELLEEQPARQAPGFDLDTAIRDGRADFGSGRQIGLILRVRGYPSQLLRICPLSDDQTCSDEPPESPFDMEVRASVPESGQLLRWLLGAGDNIEVVAPDGLRAVVQQQAQRMSAIYVPPAVEGAPPLV